MDGGHAHQDVARLSRVYADDDEARAHVGADSDGHAPASGADHEGASRRLERGKAQAQAGASVEGIRVQLGTRAKQTIPPAVRRAVLARDHRRCRVSGCRNATFLDLHHIDLRSEGGRNTLENLITICGAHHRAVHRGELIIWGSGNGGACFRHADGSEYARAARPQALEALPKVFRALRGLGFREGQVRAVVAELQKRSELREACVERLLREALQCLTPPRMRHGDG